jgi:hypothetical protein
MDRLNCSAVLLSVPPTTGLATKGAGEQPVRLFAGLHRGLRSPASRVRPGGVRPGGVRPGGVWPDAVRPGDAFGDRRDPHRASITKQMNAATTSRITITITMAHPGAERRGYRGTMV